MWNRSVRRILDLPLLTHCILLPGLIGKLSAIEQIYCRFFKMYIGMLKSENKRIEFISKLSNNDRNSITAVNLAMIAKKLNCDVLKLCLYDVNQLKDIMLAKYLGVEQTVAHIKELSQVLTEPNVFIQGFEYEEVKDLLYFLCTK